MGEVQHFFIHIHMTQTHTPAIARPEQAGALNPGRLRLLQAGFGGQRQL